MKRFSRYSTRARGRAPYSYRKSYYRRPRTYGRPAQFTPASAPRATELKCVDQHEVELRALVTIANVVGADNSLITGMTLVNGVAEGATVYQHTGNKVHMHSLALECELTQPQTDVSSSTVRLMLIYDRQSNGAYPAITTLLLNDGLFGATEFNSAININYRDRFLVLRDEQLVLDPAQALSRHYETYMKRSLEHVCITGDAAIASVGTGAIYFLAFYVQGVGTTAPKVSNLHARYRFFDA